MEGDLLFFERRLNEEIARAEAAQTEVMRSLHWRWADLYRVRIDAARTRCGMQMAPQDERSYRLHAEPIT